MKPLSTLILAGLASIYSAALFGATYYVAPGGNDSGGGEESAPFATLERAVEVAASGDTILLADGNYTRSSTSWLTIDKALTIRSINGTERVAIVAMGTGNDRRGLLLNHAEALLSGVTLRDYKSNSYTVGTAAALQIDLGTVENCAITHNSANVGSGVRVNGGTLRDSIIAYNSAGSGGNDRRGGGIFISGGVVENCDIFENRTAVGGGVSLEGANAILRNSRIFGNSDQAVSLPVNQNGKAVQSYGGGAYISAGVIENCVISNNTSSYTAGIRAHGGTIRACTIRDNHSLFGECQGIYLNAASARAYNCTIAELSSSAFVGVGLYIAKGQAEKMVVLPAAENAFPASGAVYLASSGATLLDSCIPAPEVCGENSSLANLSHFDSALAPYPSTVAAELEIGALPPAADFGAAIIASCVDGRAPLSVDFSVAADFQDEVSYLWDFGDDSPTETAAESLHTFSAPGRYTVTARAADFSATQTITVMPPETFVSHEGADIFPYDTPEKATPSLEKAYRAVYADETTRGIVNIAAGTFVDERYTSAVSWFGSFLLTLDRNVILRGESRDESIISGRNLHQVLFMQHPGARVENLTLANGRFNYNNWGSAANLLLLDGTVTNCTIRSGYGNYNGNVATYGGLITHCVVSNGNLNVSGVDRPAGGINLFGNARVEECDLCYNKGGYGAGVYIGAGSSAQARKCRIFENYGANCGGGGATILGGILEDSVIVSNRCNGGGGGVLVNNANARLRNCIIAFNASQGVSYGTKNGGGGGVYLANGKVQNCTISENTASTASGYGLYQTGGTIENSIIWGNGSGNVDTEKVGGTFAYSCTPAAIAGTGNTTLPPLFADPSGGDFSLLIGSSAIDSGTEIAEITHDLRGTARPLGDGFDMGAYEVDLSTIFACSFAADIDSGNDELTTTLRANVVGGSGTYVLYTWDFHDGLAPVTTTEPELVHTFGIGSALITLTVTDSLGATATCERASVVTVLPSTTYVAHDGSNTYPYDTWEKAALFIQDAIDAAYATDENPGKVYVADGIYPSKNNDDLFSVSIITPIHLIGTNKACQAFINARPTGTEHRALNVNHPLARVENLTISNGFYTVYSKGESGGLWLYDGVISNCVIAKNSGICAGGATIYGGLLTSSIIRDNATSTTHDGGDRYGGGVAIFGGTVEHCLIERNIDGRAGGAYLGGANAVLRNCIIQNNFSVSYGTLIIEKGLAENIIVRNNGQGYTSTGSAGANGAGVSISGNNSILRNALIYGNCHTNNINSGYSVYVENGAKVINITAVNNTASRGTLNLDIQNNGGIVANSIAGVFSHLAGTSEANFVGGDPLFKNPAAQNFSLTKLSPCVNNGDNSYWDEYPEAADFFGNPRIKMGCVDQGAIELQPPKSTIINIR